MEKISELIYEKRKAAGLTQEELAEKSNVNRITIRRYENGDFKNLDFKQLFDISKALNFNLINFLSVYFEGLTMEEYCKLVMLFRMIRNLQKDKVEDFLVINKNEHCFKTKIGNELFYYASALVADEKNECQLALHQCYKGIGVDISSYEIRNLHSKSNIFLKLMILSATLLAKLGSIKRSENIYNQVYDYISSIDSKDDIFENQLFYTDLDEYKIVILCNLSNLYNSTYLYEKSYMVCENAIKLMSKNKTLKFYYPIAFNQALSLYYLNQPYEAKKTLLQIYYFLMSVDGIAQVEKFKELINDNFPNISYITSYMVEPDLNK